MRKYFTGLSINNLLTCHLLEGRLIIKGAEGREILDRILGIDLHETLTRNYVFCKSGDSLSRSLQLAGLGLSRRPWMLEIISTLLRVDWKGVIFIILKSLQLFSWEMLYAFDHNLVLHFLTLKNFLKLTYFTAGFLCLFRFGVLGSIFGVVLVFY